MTVTGSVPSTLRTSSLAWQAPTLLLALLLIEMAVLGGALDRLSSTTLLCLGLVAVGSLLAWSDHRGRLAPPWRVVVPLLSLAAVVPLAVALATSMPAALLLGAVPALWLIFEFGRAGTVIAVLAIAGLLGLVYLLGDAPPGESPLWLHHLPVAVACAGVVLGAHQVAAGLTRREVALLEQTRRLAETLARSEDQLLILRGILESVDAVVVAYDDAGALLVDNPTARALARRSGIETDGRIPGTLHMYHEDRVTPVDPEVIPLRRVHDGQELVGETLWFGPPGDQVAILLYGHQIFRECPQGRERYGYVIVGWDVTDVLEALRVRDEFLTTVSHELRTPLTSIMGYHELMEDALGAEEERDPVARRVAGMLRVAQRNATVLLNRVGQLLQASGSSPEEVCLDEQDVDVSLLVATALAKHRSAAATVGVAFHEEVRPGLRARLDPGAWEQVVDNLVSNAVKFTPAGGEVTVALEPDAGEVLLTVADTGMGMSGIEQRRAFERFYRTAAANEAAIQGLGVGLSVVRAVVDAHAGSIAMTSEPGSGTTVEVRVSRLPGP